MFFFSIRPTINCAPPCLQSSLDLLPLVREAPLLQPGDHHDVVNGAVDAVPNGGLHVVLHMLKVPAKVLAGHGERERERERVSQLYSLLPRSRVLMIEGVRIYKARRVESINR